MSVTKRRMNKEDRKKMKLAAKRAMKAQYKAWAEAGITKKSRRHLKRLRKEGSLVSDHRQPSIQAALARPNFRGVPGYVNRKASAMVGETVQMRALP